MADETVSQLVMQSRDSLSCLRNTVPLFYWHSLHEDSLPFITLCSNQSKMINLVPCDFQIVLLLEKPIRNAKKLHIIQ